MEAYQPCSRLRARVLLGGIEFVKMKDFDYSLRLLVRMQCVNKKRKSLRVAN